MSVKKVYIRPAHGEEIFKIVTYPSIRQNEYKISNYGRLYDIKKDKFIEPYIDKDGYEKVTLRADKHNRYIGIHRLVAYEFCDGYNEELKKVIPNHLDGDPRNNFYENLEWCTTRENIQHAFDTGAKSGVKGDASNLAKYTDKQCDLACQLKLKGLSNKEISKLTGINYNYIHEIISGKKRPHIANKYDDLPKPRIITFKGFSKDTNEKILKYLKNGYKPKQICEFLNIEYNHTHKTAITNLRKKLK